MSEFTCPGPQAINSGRMSMDPRPWIDGGLDGLILLMVIADARLGLVTVSMPEQKARELGMVRPLVTPSIR